jgi:hypothetical protein
MHPPVIAAVNRRATQNRAEEIKGNGGGQECPPHTGWLGGQVVNQAVGVLDVDPGNLGLVFDYLAALLHQLAFGFLDIFDCNLEDRAQGWTFFDEEIDVLAMEAEHRGFSGDFESEMLDVEGCGAFWIWGLN